MKVRALVASLFFFFASSLLAQDTPFHAGQWAAQFNSGFSSFGVQKFRSPTRALVLDGRVSGFHRENLVEDTLQSINSLASIDLRLGWRSYRSISDKVVALHSLGVLAGFDHSVSAAPSLGTSSSNGLDAGLFTDLGAVYLITPHFGIGATGTASVFYSGSWGEANAIQGRTWSLGGNTTISFTATLFF